MGIERGQVRASPQSQDTAMVQQSLGPAVGPPSHCLSTLLSHDNHLGRLPKLQMRNGICHKVGGLAE